MNSVIFVNIIVPQADFCVSMNVFSDGPSVVTINTNGTITVELPSNVTRGVTGYKVEYRKMSTIDWTSEEYVDTLPKLLTGNLEGVEYDLMISFNNSDGFGDPVIFEVITLPCSGNRCIFVRFHVLITLNTCIR